MKKTLVLILFCNCIILSSFSQQMFNKSTKSVYVLYGHHLRTNYIVDSGQANLVGRKNVFSAEMGFNFDYPLNDKWMIRTGINGHLLFLSETTYGLSGKVPPAIDSFPVRKLYGRGIEYIESVTLGIPFKAKYTLLTTDKYIFSISGGLFIAIYFPASDLMASSTNLLNNGTQIREYNITRHFKNYKSDKSLGISYPQLEWDFDIECKRNFKKYGAVSLGIKTHIGTKRLENSTFVMFPDEPNYRSKGHFQLNRSYIGIYSAFTFSKNK